MVGVTVFDVTGVLNARGLNEGDECVDIDEERSAWREVVVVKHVDIELVVTVTVDVVIVPDVVTNFFTVGASGCCERIWPNMRSTRAFI